MSRLSGPTNEVKASSINAGVTNTIKGTARADNIYDTAGNDRIQAHGRNDFVRASDGNDVIDGGAGRDNLWGGNGDDLFLFANLNDGMRDTIRDFQGGHDMIQIDWSGPGAITSNDIDVKYMGGGGDRAIVTVDINGDGKFTKADFSIEVLGQGLSLDASDFSIV